MNFIEALEAMKKGSKVKRPYLEAIYLHEWSKVLFQEHYENNRLIKLEVLPMLRPQDYEATDWEIVE